MTLSLNIATLNQLRLIKEICFDTLRFRALALIMLATPCLSVAADSYNYSFTTASLSGSLILVTTPQGGGISLVTSATGTINSSAVTLVAPGAFAGNDNRVQIDFTQPVGSQAKFNGAGLSVQTAGPTITNYNIWGSGPGSGYSGLGILSEFTTGQLLLTNSISMVSDGPSSSSSSSPPPPVDIVSGTSVGLSSIGVTANPVLAGGTLVLNRGDSSGLSFAITSAGGTIQSPASGSAALSGVFSGTGGLTFTGTGTTIMSGANTYAGGTTVSSGTLSVAGGSPTGTGDVFVASSGTLMGTGTIAGNGLVSGVLKPGNSPGYLSFTQNLTLNAGSTYQQDIAGATQASSATPVGASGYYSFVNVGSQLTITSGATLTPRLSNLFSANESGYGSGIYVPVLGDRFRIITAGGITGRFTTLTQPAELSSGTQFIAFYNVNNSNSIDLAIAPTSYSSTLSSSTTNAKTVAGVLDQLLGVNKAGTASAAQDSLLYAVAGQTAANLPTFAQALAGEIHAASVAALPQTTQRVQQAVLARLGDYPMPPTQLNGAGINPLSSGAITGNNPSGLPTANVSSNPAVNPNAANITSAAITDGRAWGEIAYQRGVRSGNSGGNGYNNNLYQAVFGVDAYSNAALGLKLGGGLALSNTTVNATGDNSTIQQGALFVYGKMPVAQDYVLDGMVSLGLSSSKLSRSDITGISNGFSNKSVMGNDVLVSAGLSRPFETSDVRITPYVRLTYQYVGQAAYDEGSSAAALNIARLNANGVRAVIGVGAGSLNKDPLKQGYTYRANLAIGADSQGLLNPTLNTTLGGFSSSVTTPTAGSTFVQAGLYGTIKVADSAYAYAGVSAEARTGQTLYGGSVGLRLAF
jgi:autotransporter-associated beta strand protein